MASAVVADFPAPIKVEKRFPDLVDLHNSGRISLSEMQDLIAKRLELDDVTHNSASREAWAIVNKFSSKAKK